MNEYGCDATQGKLYELLRGELCSEESAGIREHIEQCSECQYEQSVCAQLSDVVKRVCEEERSECAPTHLRDAILQRLRENAAAQPSQNDSAQ